MVRSGLYRSWSPWWCVEGGLVLVLVAAPHPWIRKCGSRVGLGEQNGSRQDFSGAEAGWGWSEIVVPARPQSSLWSSPAGHLVEASITYTRVQPARQLLEVLWTVPSHSVARFSILECQLKGCFWSVIFSYPQWEDFPVCTFQLSKL